MNAQRALEVGNSRFLVVRLSTDFRMAYPQHPVWKDSAVVSTPTSSTALPGASATSRSSAAASTSTRSKTTSQDRIAHTHAPTTHPAIFAATGPASLFAEEPGFVEQPFVVPPQPTPAIMAPAALSPDAYRVVGPSTPGGALSINAQHPHIQETCRACFIQSEVDLVFDNGFPDGLERSKFVANGLITAADTLGYSGLRTRYQTDELFLRQISSMVSIITVSFIASPSPNDCNTCRLSNVSAHSGAL